MIAAGTSLVAIAFVYVYLYRTRLGTLTRAVMSRRDEALATGIDVDRVSAAAFGIGLGLAAVAGVFAPFMFGSVTRRSVRTRPSLRLPSLCWDRSAIPWARHSAAWFMASAI